MEVRLKLQKFEKDDIIRELEKEEKEMKEMEEGGDSLT